MSKIQWTDKTVNPAPGCTKVSPACDNCYAEKMAKRLSHIGYETGNQKLFEKYSRTLDHLGRWNGKVSLDISEIEKVLKWKKPQKIFVNSMGDLFHENVPFEFLEEVWAYMLSANRHTYQILTKRPERMKQFIEWYINKFYGTNTRQYVYDCKHIWLGVTAENQEMADKRIPILLQIPAAVRFISVEPMLGPIVLRKKATDENEIIQSALMGRTDEYSRSVERGIDWVICGGESGPGARPMHPEWARSLRDQCQAAGVPFLFKQWGEWSPTRVRQEIANAFMDRAGELVRMTTVSSTDRKNVGQITYHAIPQLITDQFMDYDVLFKIGKKKAGRLLDGREWNEFPEVTQ